ncbi:hypothetical protein PIB30_078962 [Stylosanthes scabra]|uniref:Uncharacterized protein n=1 Tax=Stylosanthes scabra TaxID=79078 RepID=A0ABU6QQN8_9FABA|nr:hypothetical protein [Stylosanthes scabra]
MGRAVHWMRKIHGEDAPSTSRAGASPQRRTANREMYDDQRRIASSTSSIHWATLHPDIHQPPTQPQPPAQPPHPHRPSRQVRPPTYSIDGHLQQ